MATSTLMVKTVYLTSAIKRREFRQIDARFPKISYFGNIRMGRNRSLCDIADALAIINPDYTLDVYSNEKDSAYIAEFDHHPNLVFHGSISYADVIKKRRSKATFWFLLKAMTQMILRYSRYSVSTKVADSLASGANVLAYGSEECGAIEYLESLKCATVCHRRSDLVAAVRCLISDADYQWANYQASGTAYAQNHRLESSLTYFVV